ncbi:MAG: signal peptidase [Bacilli bacterium]|nr:signal peptidase [Bacilli bacterium]
MFYALIALIILLDQVTKYLIRTHMEIGQTTSIWKDVLDFTYYQNTGAAFSILQGQRWFFIIVALLFVGIAIYYRWKGKIQGRFLEWTVALLLGGAIGNGIDRLVYNKVTDFVNPQFGFGIFGIFNFADLAINVGVILLILRMLIRPSNKPVSQGSI